MFDFDKILAWERESSKSRRYNSTLIALEPTQTPLVNELSRIESNFEINFYEKKLNKQSRVPILIKEVNKAFQQLCALLEKRKTAMINQIQTDVSERIGILSDMGTRFALAGFQRKIMTQSLMLISYFLTNFLN